MRKGEEERAKKEGEGAREKDREEKMLIVRKFALGNKYVGWLAS